MKSGWWQIQFRVKAGDIEIDFEELPTEVKREIMKKISDGAVAGAIDMEEGA